MPSVSPISVLSGIALAVSQPQGPPLGDDFAALLGQLRNSATGDAGGGVADPLPADDPGVPTDEEAPARDDDPTLSEPWCGVTAALDATPAFTAAAAWPATDVTPGTSTDALPADWAPAAETLYQPAPVPDTSFAAGLTEESTQPWPTARLPMAAATRSVVSSGAWGQAATVDITAPQVPALPVAGPLSVRDATLIAGAPGAGAAPIPADDGVTGQTVAVSEGANGPVASRSPYSKALLAGGPPGLAVKRAELISPISAPLSLGAFAVSAESDGDTTSIGAIPVAAQPSQAAENRQLSVAADGPRPPVEGGVAPHAALAGIRPSVARLAGDPLPAAHIDAQLTLAEPVSDAAQPLPTRAGGASVQHEVRLHPEAAHRTSSASAVPDDALVPRRIDPSAHRQPPHDSAGESQSAASQSERAEAAEAVPDLPRFSAAAGPLPVAEHGSRHAQAPSARPHAHSVIDVEMRDGAAHVHLDEDALGPIDVRVERSEAGLSLVMRAERSDSADLLRRNADILQRELADNGVAHARIDFGQGGGRHDSERAASRRRETGSPAPRDAQTQAVTARSAPGGLAGVQLDMRL